KRSGPTKMRPWGSPEGRTREQVIDGRREVDIPRERKNRTARRWAIGGAAGGILLFATVALARLEPAAPSVDRGGIWMDTVRQGTMVRQVRGPGALVPEQIRYISAVTAGRVERLLVEPGTAVTPETELLVLSNPEV